jgi:hypothetical protein
MKVSDEKIRKKFDALIKRGELILNRCGYHDGEFQSTWPTAIEYQQFKIEVKNLIDMVCGPESPHALAVEKMENERFTFPHIYGVLKAAYCDYDDGFLTELKHLIRADLLDDFLGQAEILLDQGYNVPAASLAGAVLEDTLRKLCDINSITYPAKTKIDSLNTELAKKNVYDKLIQKEVTAKADLRNNADHGKFSEVREADVKDMVRWIRRFVSERLT